LGLLIYMKSENSGGDFVPPGDHQKKKNTAAGVRESGGEEEGALHLGFLPKVRGRGRAGVGGGLVPHRTVSLRRPPHVRRKRRRANDDMKCLFCPRPLSKLRGRHRISLLLGYKHTAQPRVSITDEWAT
jgi:hypothetical protein